MRSSTKVDLELETHDVITHKVIISVVGSIMVWMSYSLAKNYIMRLLPKVHSELL